jgi:FkbM family methyltransferase
MTTATHAPPREPTDVKVMRSMLRRWPLRRGKGKLMRVFGPLLRDREFVMEIEPGVVVPADLGVYTLYWGFIHGYESSNAWRLSRALIRSRDTVFDVGANIGIWSLSAAHRTGSEGSVHAFEPVAETRAQLERHLALNGFYSVRCEDVALADREGTARFFEAAQENSGKSRLAHREGLQPGADVTLTTLDRYCERNRIERIDFLKVDVEGAEELVFRGGARVLPRDDAPIVMFESAEALATSAGSSCAAAKRVLAGAGYSIYSYDGESLTSVGVEDRHRQEDLFALKPAHLIAHPELARCRPSA